MTPTIDPYRLLVDGRRLNDTERLALLRAIETDAPLPSVSVPTVVRLERGADETRVVGVRP